MLNEKNHDMAQRGNQFSFSSLSATSIFLIARRSMAERKGKPDRYTETDKKMDS